MRNLFALIVVALLFTSCHHTGPVLDLKSNLESDDKNLVIRNAGDKDLVIENFTTTCECTLIKLQKGQTVKPNDSLTVPVIVEKAVSPATSKLVYIRIRTNTNPAITTVSFIN